jgi:cell division protein ZapE
MTPMERYQQALACGKLQADPEQAQAMQQLQALYTALLAQHQQQKRWWYRWLRYIKSPAAVQGLYLWGGVGIGKTCLMDMFYHSLPMTEKMRMHFHHFMKMVHTQLNTLQGHSDPLKHIAKELAKTTKLLCFDELFVSDIGDAMLLAGLFDALFAQDITLVATSNTAPDNLYWNGLQRSRFLPFIELLQQKTQVMHLDTEKDYRLEYLQQVGSYFYPLDEKAEQHLLIFYQQLSHGSTPQTGELQVNDRTIRYRACSGDIIWFDFDVLCHVPRSQLDYLVIADQFHTVLLSNVPKIDEEQYNLLTYFISLVDVFYDSHVKLILSAAVSAESLAPVNGQLAFAFQRTQSRLQEMQSEAYWHRHHTQYLKREHFDGQ